MKNLIDTVASNGKTPLIRTEGSMALGDSQNTRLDETSPYSFERGHRRLLRLSVPCARRMAAEKELPTITVSQSGAYGPRSWFKESVFSYIKNSRGMFVGKGQSF